jgi:hypothetical protein
VHDILVETVVDRALLQQAVGEIFEVSSDDVQVVGEIDGAEEQRRVIAVLSPAKGDFDSLLSLYIHDSVHEKPIEEVAKHICFRLNTRALIADDSADPYSMLLFEPTGHVKPVDLDVESIDERGEYRFLR